MPYDIVCSMASSEKRRRVRADERGGRPDISSTRSLDDVWDEWVQTDPELGELLDLTVDEQDRFAAFLRSLAAYRKKQQERTPERGKFTQDWLAERMGTSQPRVAVLERGDQDIKSSTLARYVAALGCRLELCAIDHAGRVVASSGALTAGAASDTEQTSSSLEQLIDRLVQLLHRAPGRSLQPTDARWLVERFSRGDRSERETGSTSSRSPVDTGRVSASYQILTPALRDERAALAEAVSETRRELAEAAV